MMTLDEALKYCITQTSELRDRVAYVEDFLVATRGGNGVAFSPPVLKRPELNEPYTDDDEHNDGPEVVSCPGCETPVFWDTASGSWRCPRCKAKGAPGAPIGVFR